MTAIDENFRLIFPVYYAVWMILTTSFSQDFNLTQFLSLGCLIDLSTSFQSKAKRYGNEVAFLRVLSVRISKVDGFLALNTLTNKIDNNDVRVIRQSIVSPVASR